MHERRNGKFILQVTAHPDYGLPWGQDRLVPIFLATLAIRQQCQTISFASGAEMLDNLETTKALSCAPAALDLFTWLAYRCFAAKGEEKMPLFGDFGLQSQLGSIEYARPRKFREKLQRCLDLVRTLWPECPARISSDGTALIVAPAIAILAKESASVRC